MKTKEELETIKEEYKALSNKLNELSDEELKHISGGMKIFVIDDDPEELSWWEKFLKIFFKN